MYSYIAQPPVARPPVARPPVTRQPVSRPPIAQSFLISMITTIITMNFKDRVTHGSPWTELTRWCANVE